VQITSAGPGVFPRATSPLCETSRAEAYSLTVGRQSASFWRLRYPDSGRPVRCNGCYRRDQV